eukprot:TRINITY_DN13974_c0_g1_i1.p1 TRINITY_DN13974_c0_g1~~TRINITY_DN13974_c0_g1_i1.p1  ORF type:complete len:524 (+),score=118.39 TRINITY_DN13974_c0_g1_i1:146-1717(+)
MKLRAVFLVIIVLLHVHCGVHATCIRDLHNTVEAILAANNLTSAVVGVHAKSAASGQDLFSFNSHLYCTPASNNKLFTTSSAFLNYPANYSITTPIYAPAAGSAIPLCITGAYDPTISNSELASLAAAISAAGVKSITTLTLDDAKDRFPNPGIDSSWELEDIESDDGASPSAFIVNRNMLQLRVSAATVAGQPLVAQWEGAPAGAAPLIQMQAVTVSTQADELPLAASLVRGDTTVLVTGALSVGAVPQLLPVTMANTTLLFAQYLSDALNAAGVAVNAVAFQSCAGVQQQQQQPRWTIQSESLRTIVNWTLHVSDNLYAEALLRVQGQTLQMPEMNAREAGLAAVMQTLNSFGVPNDVFRQHDGSGLSRRNLVNAKGVVRLLELMQATPRGPLLRACLPEAGVSGTISDRFIGTPAQGRVFAKTGTLTGVSSLSGYIESDTYPDMTFSVLMCNSMQHTAVLEAAIDSIVLELFAVQPCSLTTVIMVPIGAFVGTLLLLAVGYAVRRCCCVKKSAESQALLH